MMKVFLPEALQPEGCYACNEGGDCGSGVEPVRIAFRLKNARFLKNIYNPECFYGTLYANSRSLHRRALHVALRLCPLRKGLVRRPCNFHLSFLLKLGFFPRCKPQPRTLTHATDSLLL